LNYADRWTPAWGTIDDDIYAEIFTDRCKRAPIVNLQTVKAHLRPYFTPDIRRVVTHNNWGEYGHARHRVVNVVVRQLAVELGLDVWALGTRVGIAGADHSDYVDVAKTTGLPTIEAYFDADLFRAVRSKYLEFAPAASTPELTKKFRQWSPTLWTWSSAHEAYPIGWRCGRSNSNQRRLPVSSHESILARVRGELDLLHEWPARRGVQPQRAGTHGRINPGFAPPRGFVAATVHLAMVSSTQWNGVLIADLSSECPALGKSQVVGIGGLATANQTRMFGDSFDVIPVMNPALLRKAQYALIDRFGPRLVLWLPWVSNIWCVRSCLRRLARSAAAASNMSLQQMLRLSRCFSP
jgi:hypothetical protein